MTHQFRRTILVGIGRLVVVVVVVSIVGISSDFLFPGTNISSDILLSRIGIASDVLFPRIGVTSDILFPGNLASIHSIHITRTETCGQTFIA